MEDAATPEWVKYFYGPTEEEIGIYWTRSSGTRDRLYSDPFTSSIDTSSLASIGNILNGYNGYGSRDRFRTLSSITSLSRSYRSRATASENNRQRNTIIIVTISVLLLTIIAVSIALVVNLVVLNGLGIGVNNTANEPIQGTVDDNTTSSISVKSRNLTFKAVKLKTSNGMWGDFLKTKIYMPNAIFYKNDVFQTLPCNVTNPEQWSTLILYFTPSVGARRILVTVFQSGSVEVCYHDRHVVTADYSISRYFLKLNVHFLRDVCRFAGRYTCSLETPSFAYNYDASVVIQAHPQTPVISVPSLMIDQKMAETPMSCQGFVGKPMGTLAWQIKLQTESVYMELNTTNESEVIETQCDVIMVSNLTFTPTSNMNLAHIRCVSTNDIVPNSPVLFSEVQIHVLEETAIFKNRSSQYSHNAIVESAANNVSRSQLFPPATMQELHSISSTLNTSNLLGALPIHGSNLTNQSATLDR